MKSRFVNFIEAVVGIACFVMIAGVICLVYVCQMIQDAVLQRFAPVLYQKLIQKRLRAKEKFDKQYPYHQM